MTEQTPTTEAPYYGNTPCRSCPDGYSHTRSSGGCLNCRRPPHTLEASTAEVLVFRLAKELHDLSERVKSAGEQRGAIVNWRPAYERAQALLREYQGGDQ